MPFVLVAEDSQLMQLYYRQVLQGMSGIQFAVVRNGQEALTFIAKKGTPDLVVLDINMPVMDGLEFLDNYRGSNPGTPSPVVVISTEGREDDVKRALAAGASAYLTKPFKAEELQQMVRKLVPGQPRAGAST
jgi:two-component system, chemotaxis family, chemotaxis protein CheY